MTETKTTGQTGVGDLRLTPLDVGFDLRLQDISVTLPQHFSSVSIERHGETYLIEGTREEMVEAIADAGYRLPIPIIVRLLTENQNPINAEITIDNLGLPRHHPINLHEAAKSAIVRHHSGQTLLQVDRPPDITVLTAHNHLFGQHEQVALFYRRPDGRFGPALHAPPGLHRYIRAHQDSSWVRAAGHVFRWITIRWLAALGNWAQLQNDPWEDDQHPEPHIIPN